MVVDGRGRMGGLLTGGAGIAVSSDVSYATPMWWLLEVVRAEGFPEARLVPPAVTI